MSPDRHDLLWEPESVASFMRSRGVRDRAELVKLKLGVGQTTIYRSFDERWAGRVRVRMLAALAQWAGLPLSVLVGELIREPSALRRRSADAESGNV